MFSTLSFMKSKSRNYFNKHLHIVVGMYSKLSIVWIHSTVMHDFMTRMSTNPSRD
jgi:hypothetical protein